MFQHDFPRWYSGGYLWRIREPLRVSAFKLLKMNGLTAEPIGQNWFANRPSPIGGQVPLVCYSLSLPHPSLSGPLHLPAAGAGTLAGIPVRLTAEGRLA